MRVLRFFCFAAAFVICGRAGTVEITVLATTDLHGNIYPYDYLTGRNADRGLAKIATLIKAERKASAGVLLLDCGDTIQGSPLESVYQQFVRTGKFPLNLKPSAPLTADPMMLAMNHLRYDAMTVGNHEFNFGLDNLQKARAAAQFPWISANIRTHPSSGRKPFAPYISKVISGVKVVVIGMTTPAVPQWEKPENLRDYTFADAKTSVTEALAEARRREKPDLVIVASHAGVERDLKTGVIREGNSDKENMVYEVATEVPGIDAIVFGHTHQELEQYRSGGVLLVQPKNWGMSLARLNFTLESRPDKGYRVVQKSSRLLPVTRETQADPDILRMMKPYHDLTEAYLNSFVAEAPAHLSGSRSRIEDSGIIDAIHAVQLHYAKADVSFTAAFNPRAAIPKGPVTVRQVAALYVYDNELYAIQGSGRMVREALENAAKYFNSCPEPTCTTGPLINKQVIGFNYDMAQGVTYEIDLTRRPGDRVQNLKFKGEPLKDGRPLRVAVNNYRAAGSGGYTMFKGAKILWRSYEDIRELIMRYYTSHSLPDGPDHNWRVVPESAHRVLQQESTP